MNLWTLLLQGWLIVAGVMLALWLVQRKTNDAGIVDVGWAANLGVLAINFALVADGWAVRRVLMATLVSIWAFRLAGYLFFNRVLGKPEDGRYQELRRNRPQGVQAFFFFFFQAQGLLDVILSIPFAIIALDRTASISPWEWIGVAVWLISVAGETLADRQLARFRADPANRGRTCRIGLWRYSRHPNYFFEWLHWWTYVLMACGSPLFALTFLPPVIMLFLIVKVTGIPPTEAQALRSRGDDYRAYQRTTSPFIPWFPRKDAS